MLGATGLNNDFIKREVAYNYRTNDAFKILEIQHRFKFLTPGMKVLELGSAPGSITEVLVEQVQSSKKKPSVVSIDQVAMPPVIGSRFMKDNFLSNKVITEVMEHFDYES